MTSRKKPGVVFWATVTLVVTVLYVLSFGPACWMLDMRDGTPITYAGSIWGNDELLDFLYAPLEFACNTSPVVDHAVWWYGCLWTK